MIFLELSIIVTPLVYFRGLRVLGDQPPMRRIKLFLGEKMFLGKLFKWIEKKLNK